MRLTRSLLTGEAAVGVAVVGVLPPSQQHSTPDAHSFESHFTVSASLEAVARFHSDPSALRQLMPAPMQVHRLDPMWDGSVSEFTMWVDPDSLASGTHGARCACRVHGHAGGRSDGALGALPRVSLAGTGANRGKHRIWGRSPRWRGVLTWMVFSTLRLRVLFRYCAWATRPALS
jgi:hypothetical protein